ncbi:Ring finger domain [Phytophthora infestans]|uniref:Ring finger domain n=1 Tax=Phytophthora infestans TaxID=4787 RepID=A0A8S9U5M7_PHYIN|nr:Ring finger domain [Phytophthora infestans]
MDGTQQQRVLADGWGQQSSGSVFCADSSLRYIYESNGQHAPTSRQAIGGYSNTNKVQPQVYGKSNSVSNMTVAGKRPRDFSSENPRPNGGVDLFEAEIARACTAIRKQTASMPHSYRECSVCLSANAYAQISSCGHTFHPNCFLRWFRLNRSCPLCRGVVDKVQLAQTIGVQDELEAIMAEIDDEPLQLMRDAQQLPRSESDVAALDDPLLANSDQLMSFLESDFDTDMELAALDDLSSSPGFELAMKQEADGDETMSMELDELVDSGDKQEGMATPGYAAPSNFAPQFPPASAMPNYWNVLNQGIAPPIMPPAPAVPPYVPNHQRMVHIAPKPDAQRVRSPVATTARATEPTFKMPVPQAPQHSHHHHVVRSTAPTAPRVVSCRCTGGCRNGRCACVKEGGMCGASCRCTSCKNPFLMVKAAGADIDALFKDDCFMHNVSKTRDMVVRLQEPVAVPCCEATIKVVDCVQGYTCVPCKRRYDFSWCMNKLVDSERTPRNHCAICKRCCDHRDVHCHDCGRCYFAGVAASLPCPCKEASSHKKRREAAAKDKAEEAEEEAEGECCIM